MFLDLKLGNLTEAISGRQWDRQEILCQVAARVRRYHGEGMGAGDRVFVPFGNRLEFFAELLSIWHLGASAIPMDPRLTPFEVETLAQAASPRFSLVDDKSDPTIVPRMSSLSTKLISMCRL